MAAIERGDVNAKGRPEYIGVDKAISQGMKALLRLQHGDGHWVFELEADATIPAEYILLVHYRGESADTDLERKIGNYLRRIQGRHGGWSLVHDGPFDLSASVKAYFALKMIGDAPDAQHMVRARSAILAAGGAGSSNVFTRFLLALYGFLSWRHVPMMPPEIILLPSWFPFHLSKISYWARTVLVPLTVLQALRPVARNPRGIRVDELFDDSSVAVSERAPHQSRFWSAFFGFIDNVLQVGSPYFPQRLRRRALDRAIAFVRERLNGEDGLGAIFPAMANALMMFDALGFSADHDAVTATRNAIDRLLVIKDDEAYCQPCLSPVWDTALVAHTLLEIGGVDSTAALQRGLEWLLPRQVLNVRGDWADRRPEVSPGGWAFQYANPYYPDVDDTAVVAMLLDRAAQEMKIEVVPYPAVSRAKEWLRGMQSSNGGWAAFDVDNCYDYLNEIPFADHGALLDPPTADVTARCVGAFSQFGESLTTPCLTAALRYLQREQRVDGSWFGRWGMNYIYGTWSTLVALAAAGIPPDKPMVCRAAEWLLRIQNEDGGWGEGAESYALDYDGFWPAPSTPSQTAWALLGLMAAGMVDHASVLRGINYLLGTQDGEGLWQEPRFTATGFPRAFYLRYHGYCKYFPLWALARYRRLTTGNRYLRQPGM